MHEAGAEGLWPMTIQPVADRVDIGQAVRAGPAFELTVALKLLHPTLRLALEETLRLAEVAQSYGSVVDQGDA